MHALQLKPVCVSETLKKGVKFVKWDDVSSPRVASPGRGTAGLRIDRVGGLRALPGSVRRAGAGRPQSCPRRALPEPSGGVEPAAECRANFLRSLSCLIALDRCELC